MMTPTPPTDALTEIANAIGASIGIDGGEVIGLALSVAHKRPDWYRSDEDTRQTIGEILRSLRVAILSPRVSPDAAPGKLRDEVLPSPAISDPAGTIGTRQWRGVSVNATFRHTPACPWRSATWPTGDDGQIIPCICGVTNAYDRGPSARVPGASDVRLLIALAIEQEWAAIERKRLRHDVAVLPKKARNDIRRAAKATGVDRAKIIGKAIKACPGKESIIMAALRFEQAKLARATATPAAPPEDWTSIKVRAIGTLRDVRRLRSKL